VGAGGGAPRPQPSPRATRPLARGGALPEPRPQCLSLLVELATLAIELRPPSLDGLGEIAQANLLRNRVHHGVLALLERLLQRCTGGGQLLQLGLVADALGLRLVLLLGEPRQLRIRPPQLVHRPGEPTLESGALALGVRRARLELLPAGLEGLRTCACLRRGNPLLRELALDRAQQCLTFVAT